MNQRRYEPPTKVVRSWNQKTGAGRPFLETACVQESL